MSVIRRSDLVVTPWKNGLGRKADVASTDDWFVGLAWIEARAAFSDFTGMDRTIVLIEGDEFTLTAEGRPPQVLRGVGAMHSFAGELPVAAEPFAGSCTVLNVMTRRGAWTHRVAVGGELPVDGFALVLRGSVADPVAPAGPGDLVALPHAGDLSPDFRAVTVELTPALA